MKKSVQHYKKTFAALRQRLGLMVIVVANQKGGVGKTTFTRFLGEWFCHVLGLRVLYIDKDPQCNLSKLSVRMESTPHGARPPIIEDGERSSSASMYFEDEPTIPYEVAMPPQPEDGRLEILPGDSAKLVRVAQQSKLSSDERVNSELVSKIKIQLRNFLSQTWEDDDGHEVCIADLYDLVIIDPPPAGSLLQNISLKAATHLVIPLEPTQQSVDGLGEMMSVHVQEETQRRADHPLSLLAIQWNKVKPQRRKTESEMIKRASAHPSIGEYFSPVIIHDRAEISARDVPGLNPRSVFHLKESEPSKVEVVAFCEYIMKRLQETSGDRGAMYPTTEMKFDSKTKEAV